MEEKEEKTIPWDIAFSLLDSNGFDVYPPYTKVGECKKPYVVLMATSVSKATGLSTEYHFYEVLCYANLYTEVMQVVADVKECMQKVFPLFMPTGQETPPFYDNDVNAFMVSIEYRNNARNKFL